MPRGVGLQDGSGKISLRMLQSYANKYGGETLTLDELRDLFQDFKPASEHYINLQEFLRFFSKVSATITNKDFEAMIEEMSS
jgi:Ca2+-binding EF-hand superfamily protein